MTIEIVDLPINSMVMFHSYVKLPEGLLYVCFNTWNGALDSGLDLPFFRCIVEDIYQF